MKRRAGFTIIELAVALAVTITLLGVAVVRYNQITAVQDFNTKAQELVNCIRGAQQLAQHPNNPNYSWTAAEFKKADLANPSYITGCEVLTFLKGENGTEPQTVADLDYTTNPSDDRQIAFTGWSGMNVVNDRWTDSNGTVSEIGGPIRIYFGVAEHGKPVKIINANSAELPNLYDISGTGLEAQLEDVADTHTILNLSINVLGQPIQITQP